MKFAKIMLVLVLAVAFAVPAFAETQNVRVSGSIDTYWFYRSDYDLVNGNDASVVAAGTAVPAAAHAGSTANRSEADDYLRTNTQIEIDADLTDNVSTVINIVNQRDWETPNASNMDVDLDLAYVQLREAFYAPLTLTIGRQDLWFGRGFIIGNNWTSWDANGSTGADEYSVTTSFDAVRATLDFNPWTIDLVYSKIAEGTNNAEDDIDLYIANINYRFSDYNAVAELYYVGEFDRSTLASAAGTFDNETDTIGGRVQFDPISAITLGAEFAYQFGDYKSSLIAATQDRAAWALDVFGTYRFDNAWRPELTLEYVHFSGDETGGSDFEGWNSLYRGKFYTAYADFREFLYATGDAIDQSGRQNQQLFQVKGAIKPLDDLLLEASYSYIWNDEQIGGRDEEIGHEVDLQATYDYTEDVSFGLLAAWFIPGDFYNSPNDETATDVVSSVKVTF